jgi:hypothetical protein
MSRNRIHLDANGNQTCIHGHPLDADNTYICPKGYKICKICRRESYNRHIKNVKELEKRRALALQEAR